MKVAAYLRVSTDAQAEHGLDLLGDPGPGQNRLHLIQPLLHH